MLEFLALFAFTISGLVRVLLIVGGGRTVVTTTVGIQSKCQMRPALVTAADALHLGG